MKVVTLATPELPGGVIRYVEQASSSFDDVCFDIDALQRQGLLEGLAEAGRGNTVFFRLHSQELVLRHYLRGGLAQVISRNQYVFLGMQRTRAFREFDLLLHLQSIGFPAPRPYACRVVRRGFKYTASLVTYRLTGRTLAECMLAQTALSSEHRLKEASWCNIGDAIAKLHLAGVYHADLNAHNIMLEDDGRIALLDFDRGRLCTLPAEPVNSGWCLNNMNRLERSLKKIVAAMSADHPVITSCNDGFAMCKQQWAISLMQSR